jgi:1,2-dihydroxy-3-keto-5-methylthiopentene dioxygenase
MSSLSVYHVSSPDLPNKVLTHFDDIAATLAEQGVRFERGQATVRVEPGASPEEVIAAYQGPIDQLMTAHGYAAIEVLSVKWEHPQQDPQQARFLAEHHHAADEMRFFVAGRGLLNLHIGEYVYAVLCERNDLISVPAGTPQWFDLGEQPRVIAIRLFKDPQGGVAHFSGAEIAEHFPRLED